MLPYAVNYVPYTAAHVLTQLQLLLFSGLAFFVMLNYLKRTPTITLDVDWFWRVAGPRVIHAVGSVIGRMTQWLGGAVSRMRARITSALVRQQLPGGLLLRSWPTGSMSLWVMLMLLANLLLYYL